MYVPEAPVEQSGVQQALSVSALALSVFSGIAYMATANAAALALLIGTGISAVWLNSSDPNKVFHTINIFTNLFHALFPFVPPRTAPQYPHPVHVAQHQPNLYHTSVSKPNSGDDRASNKTADMTQQTAQVNGTAPEQD
jgi:hypothetical protein